MLIFRWIVLLMLLGAVVSFMFTLALRKIDSSAMG